MNKKLSIFLMVMFIFSMVGGAFANDNVQLNGMNPDQSIGNQGVMDFTNKSNNNPVNGLCVDEGTYIDFRDIVPVTDGTNGVKNASKVKSLIINNYKPDMTKQQGYDLQGAIWFFTDGKTPTNPEQQSMIDNAIADTNEYADIYCLLVNNKTYLVSNITTNETKLVDKKVSKNSNIEQISQTSVSSNEIIPDGQTIETNSVTNFLGSTTDVATETIDHTDKVCTIVTTTVTNFYNTITTIITTSFFKNVTTTNITTWYKNTTTITVEKCYQDTLTTNETYTNVLDYLCFTFDSVQKCDKQKLILFTVTSKEICSNYSNVYVNYNDWKKICEKVKTNEFSEETQKIDINCFNETNTNIIETPFSNQTQTVDISCKDKEKNETVVTVNNETIPMQTTGVPIAAGLLSALAILGGFVAAKRK